MKIKGKFLRFLADVFVKIFQIIFAMLVIGMFLREKFLFSLFVFGLIASFLSLTAAIFLYYTGTVKGEG